MRGGRFQKSGLPGGILQIRELIQRKDLPGLMIKEGIIYPDTIFNNAEDASSS
jgi:hypothetical protein